METLRAERTHPSKRLFQQLTSTQTLKPAVSHAMFPIQPSLLVNVVVRTGRVCTERLEVKNKTQIANRVSVQLCCLPTGPVVNAKKRSICWTFIWIADGMLSRLQVRNRGLRYKHQTGRQKRRTYENR